MVEDGCFIAFDGVEFTVPEISVGGIHASIGEILAMVLICAAVIATGS